MSDRAGRYADWGLALALALGASLFALYLHGLWAGQLPDINSYFGADTTRVIENLADPRSNYYRATVHPLMPLADGLFQRVTAFFGLDALASLRLLALVNGAAFAALSFAVMRALRVERLLAAAFTVLGCSSAAFVYWAAVPETHFLAGLCLLAAIAVLISKPLNPIDGLVRSMLGFVLSFSIVITNAMLWGLAQLPFEPLVRRRFGEFVKETEGHVVSASLALLAGVGLIALLQTLTCMLLDNITVGRLLLLIEENAYLEPARSALSAFNALGLVASDLPGAGLINLVGVIAIAAGLFRTAPDRLFVPGFVLCGVALHHLYDPAETTLFSPNYLPVAICAVALALTGWRPRLAAAGVLAAAVVLLFVNVRGYEARITALKPQSWPAELYWSLPKARFDLKDARDKALEEAKQQDELKLR